MRTLAEKYLSSSAFLWSPPDEGGAPAPAATPPGGDTGSPSAVPDAGATNSDDAFSGFDSAGDDDGLDSIDLGTATAPSPATPAAPAAAPAAATPAPATPAAPASPATPAAPAATAPATEGVAPAPAPSELDAFVQSVDSNAAALTDWLAANAFALTKEDADALELDAAAHIPKIMAKVAVNNMKSTMNIVKNLVPKMIAAEVAKITTSQTKQKEALNEFYTANPHLNEATHGALVTKWANAYRAANPKASRKEAIDYVGRAVSFEAGVAPGAAPAAPRAAPFAPAVPGARGPVATNTEAPSPFAALGMDLDE